MERIFFDYGIEICFEDSKYYLIFDDGGIVSHLTNFEILKEHAEQAMKSPKDAGEVILHYQRIRDKERKKE
mgnify:CR=1 FL=1|jgi:hypothetical protein